MAFRQCSTVGRIQAHRGFRGRCPADVPLGVDDFSEFTLASVTICDPYTHEYQSPNRRRGILTLATTLGVTKKLVGVSYGGVPLTELPGSPLAFMGVNIGAWFLGSGIPQGDQQIVYDLDCSIDAASGTRASTFGILGSADMVVDDITILTNASLANPSVDLDITADAACVALFESGHDLASAIVAGAGWQEFENQQGLTSTSVWTTDENWLSRPGPDTVTMDWVAAAEEVAVFAVAIREDV